MNTEMTARQEKGPFRKNAGHLLGRIPAGKIVLAHLFLFTLIFQIGLMLRAPVLYPVLRILFVSGMAFLLVEVIKSFDRYKLFLLCAAFIIVIRVPFYIHADGMILSSDNALEALQSQEIRDDKTAPFFLLDSSGHNGTWKYFCVAFLWDFFGSRYLFFVLFQLMIFIAFLYLFYRKFRPIGDKRVLFLFILTHFIFIEVILDYSLFLRAGPYMEMLFFFFLGVFLFDFGLKDKSRIFLSFYFIGFSAYLHPMALFFATAFTLCSFVYIGKSRSFPKNLSVLLAGVLTGSFHLIYYEIFYPKPVSAGGWYKTVMLPVTSLSPAQIPKLAVRLLTDFVKVFINLFSFEFNYAVDFFQLQGTTKILYEAINAAGIILSLSVFFCALVLAVRRILRLRKEKIAAGDWSVFFFLFLFIAVMGRLFLLSPKPFYEPRHNIDLAFLVMMACLCVFSSFYKIKRLISFKAVFLCLLLLTLGIPSYHCFLKSVRFKEAAYKEICSVLERNGVRYLSTDFIIAYPIYFLTDRRVKVSDSLGPVTIPFFYPHLKAYVDRIPESHKAYLFFNDNYPRDEGHRKITNFKKMRLLDLFYDGGLKHRVIKLPYHTIIIPGPARFTKKPG